MDNLTGAYQQRNDSIGSYDAFRELHEPCSVDLLRASIIQSLNKRAVESQGFLERRYDGTNSNSVAESKSSAKYAIVKVESFERKQCFETELTDEEQTNFEDPQESIDIKGEKTSDKLHFVKSLSFNSSESSGEHSDLEKTYDDWEMRHFKSPENNQRNRSASNANSFKLASRKFSDSIFEDCSTYDITCFNEDLNNERNISTPSIGHLFSCENYSTSAPDDSLTIDAKNTSETDLFSMKENFYSKSINSSVSEDLPCAKVESNCNGISGSFEFLAPSPRNSFEERETVLSDNYFISKEQNLTNNLYTFKGSVSGDPSSLENASLAHTDDLSQRENESNSQLLVFPNSTSKVSLKTQETNQSVVENYTRKNHVAFAFRTFKKNEKRTDEHTSLYDTFFSRVTNGECQSPPTPTIQKMDLKWPDSSEKTAIGNLNNADDNSEETALPVRRKHSKRHRKRSKRKGKSKKSYVYECSKCGVSYIIPTKAMNDVACCLHCDLWTPVEPLFIKTEKQSWNTCRIS